MCSLIALALRSLASSGSCAVISHGNPTEALESSSLRIAISCGVRPVPKSVMVRISLGKSTLDTSVTTTVFTTPCQRRMP